MKKTTLILLLFTTLITWSQNFKFGKVSKAELEEKSYNIDSNANAVVLYSERKTEYNYSYDNGFVITEKYFTRIKIYNKEGYEYATKKIATFHGGSKKESILGIKAVTYNLENGMELMAIIQI